MCAGAVNKVLFNIFLQCTCDMPSPALTLPNDCLFMFAFIHFFVSLGTKGAPKIKVKSVF